MWYFFPKLFLYHIIGGLILRQGAGQWCDAEKLYLAVAMLYYLIALFIKLKEGIKFSKGEVW